MDQKIVLYVALIGAGSAVIGSLMAQFFSFFQRKDEYNQKHLSDFLTNRLSAHDAISKVVYEVHEHLADILYPGGGDVSSVQAKEITYQGLISSVKKIGATIQNYSLWADVVVLQYVGKYRGLLVDFSKLVHESPSELPHQSKVEFTDQTTSFFSQMMQIIRQSSGILFLNRKMKKFVPGWFVAFFKRIFKRNK